METIYCAQCGIGLYWQPCHLAGVICADCLRREHIAGVLIAATIQQAREDAVAIGLPGQFRS